MAEKRYLGDGVYVDLEGDTVVLTTDNGIKVSNRIYLEPEVLREFVRWIDSPNRRISGPASPSGGVDGK